MAGTEALYHKGQGPKPKKTKYGRYVQDITKEEIASVFSLPAEEACVKLGICLTILKRLCRKFGIQRWPYRRLKCTLKADEIRNELDEHASPPLHQPVPPAAIPPKHADRPRRNASLGVQHAVGKAKEDYDDDSVCAGRGTNNAGISSSPPRAHAPLPPAVPEPRPDMYAQDSMSADEAQALNVLMEALQRSKESGNSPRTAPSALTSSAFQTRKSEGSHSVRGASTVQQPAEDARRTYSNPGALNLGLESLIALHVQQQQQQLATAASTADLLAALLPALQPGANQTDVIRVILELTAALAQSQQQQLRQQMPHSLVPFFYSTMQQQQQHHHHSPSFSGAPASYQAPYYPQTSFFGGSTAAIPPSSSNNARGFGKWRPAM